MYKLKGTRHLVFGDFLLVFLYVFVFVSPFSPTFVERQFNHWLVLLMH